MKRKLIEKTQQSSITCDNPECEYTIPYSESEEKYLAFYIDKSCPECGMNLLTAEDYFQHKRMIKIINWLNKWFSWTCYFYSQKSWEKRQSVSVHVHDGIKIKSEIEKL